MAAKKRKRKSRSWGSKFAEKVRTTQNKHKEDLIRTIKANQEELGRILNRKFQ